MTQDHSPMPTTNCQRIPTEIKDHLLRQI